MKSQLPEVSASVASPDVTRSLTLFVTPQTPTTVSFPPSAAATCPQRRCLRGSPALLEAWQSLLLQSNPHTPRTPSVVSPFPEHIHRLGCPTRPSPGVRPRISPWPGSIRDSRTRFTERVPIARTNEVDRFPSASLPSSSPEELPRTGYRHVGPTSAVHNIFRLSKTSTHVSCRYRAPGLSPSHPIGFLLTEETGFGGPYPRGRTLFECPLRLRPNL